MKYRYDILNKNPYESHQIVLNLIKGNSKVLDIGCATGYMDKVLTDRGCEVWGIDNDEIALGKACRFCDKVINYDLNSGKALHIPKKHFDYILMIDVIEHLPEPDKVLDLIKPFLKKGGKIIFSIPNIAHASVRWMLLNGGFNYSEQGIMDRTHIHFYTKDTFQKFLTSQGYKIIQMVPTNGMCKVPFLYKITDRIPQAWQYWLVKQFPALFGYQFITLTELP